MPLSKESIAARKKAWALKNAEKIREQRRAFRIANHSRIREQAKSYYRKNAERIKAKSRAYHAENREELIPKIRQRQQKNKIAFLATCAAWRARNPEKVRLAHANWNAKHPGYHNESMRRRKYRIRIATVGDIAEVRKFYRFVKTSPSASCHYCLKELARGDRHVDHLLPLTRGGLHTRSNLVCSCDQCNRRKNKKTPDEFKAYLIACGIDHPFARVA